MTHDVLRTTDDGQHQWYGTYVSSPQGGKKMTKTLTRHFTLYVAKIITLDA